ncbi:MAG: precorrin-6y C5,15-methyltransferase (decarboxylating) subunit CbiE [Veillonellales bacterium]
MEHKITVVGIGPGSPEYLPPIAQKAIDSAAILVGSQRALDTFATEKSRNKVIDKDIAGVLAFIRACLQEEDVVVMVSGDPGFYSLLTALRGEFSADRLSVIPGISSVQLAFARLADTWQDAVLVSMHGRSPDTAMLQYAKNKKLGILTDRRHSPQYIARELLRCGWPIDAAVCLCAGLSYADEHILTTTLAATAELAGFDHCVMVVTE